MANIRTLLDRNFLRDMLNGVSTPLEVQCAVLDTQGRVVMRAERPLPPNGMPFDISDQLTSLRLIPPQVRSTWRKGFHEMIADSMQTSKVASRYFRSNSLTLFQCVAPIKAGDEHVGLLASGKIPLESKSALLSLAETVRKRARTPAERNFAHALSVVGSMPKGKAGLRCSMVSQAAQAASHVAADSLRKAQALGAKRRQMEAFAAVMSRLGPPHSLRETLKRLVHQAVVALGASVGSVKLYDDSDGTLPFAEIRDARGRKKHFKGKPFKVFVKEGGPEDSLSAWVFRHKQPRVTPDVREEPLWCAPPWEALSAIHVPLLAHKNPIGVLAVDSDRLNAFSLDDQAMLQLLARQGAVAVETAWHDELVARVRRVLMEVLRVSPRHEPIERRNSVLRELVTLIKDVMKPRAGSVIVRSENHVGRLVIPEKCEFGIKKRRHPLRLFLGEGLAGRAIKTTRMQFSYDVRTDPRFAEKDLARRHGLVSSLSVPIMKEKEAIGALNYYSGVRKEFSRFEVHALQTLCGIAGMVISATEKETVVRYNILDCIATGVTLVAIPDDWEKRDRKRRAGDPDWNKGLKMPLLFMNKWQKEQFAQKAEIGLACYKAFNTPEQNRPCWWCPTLRTMITGRPHTSFTHSPVLPKNRVEHFEVTASILKEGRQPTAAIESVIQMTKELEARWMSIRLMDATDEREVFDLGAQCLGRGTRADAVVFMQASGECANLRIAHVFTVDNRVCQEESKAIPARSDWGKGTPLGLPRVERFFIEREQKGSILFREEARHPSTKKEIPEALLKASRLLFRAPSGIKVMEGSDVSKMLHGMNLLNGGRKAILVRLGARANPWGCIVVLDEKPQRVDPAYDEYERHWCTEIAVELSAKVESIRSQKRFEAEARFREAVVRHAPVGVIVTDRKGTITEANLAWQTMCGGNPIGENLIKLTSVRNAGLLPLFDSAIRGEERRVDMLPFHSIYGKDLVLSGRCAPLRDPRGRVSGLLISVWDMTELDRAQKKLITGVQREAELRLAEGAVHELGSPAHATKMASDDLSRRVKNTLRAYSLLANARMKPAEWRHIQTVSDMLLRQSKVSPACLPSHGIKRTDVIRHALLEHNLPAQDHDVRSLAQARLAPHMKALLGVEKGRHAGRVFSYFLTLGELVTTCRNMQTDSAQVGEIVSALKDYSYVVGREMVRADLNATIDSALVLLRYLLAISNVRVERKLSPKLRKVVCVPSALIQLWCKLIENSVAAIGRTPRRGRIIVETRMRRHGVAVRVTDNGCGIPRSLDIENLGRQLPKSVGDTTGGFGLYIAREIVRMHLGSMHFDSIPGRGATVTVFVPTTGRPRKSCRLAEGKYRGE